ncbi:MAG: VOC family protein [Blastocatellia bacterium]|nr:VOC family protein [Blastocatellia bacterium]
MAEISVTGIDHVVLRVRNLERAIGFYTQVLGCQVERRQDELGLVQLRAGTSLIDLMSTDGKLGRAGGKEPGSDGHNMDHLCLRVANFDVERISAYLREKGVAVGEIGSRYGAGGEAISIYLKDSEGNGLELRG